MSTCQWTGCTVVAAFTIGFSCVHEHFGDALTCVHHLAVTTKNIDNQTIYCRECLDAGERIVPHLDFTKTLVAP